MAVWQYSPLNITILINDYKTPKYYSTKSLYFIINGMKYQNLFKLNVFKTHILFCFSFRCVVLLAYGWS